MGAYAFSFEIPDFVLTAILVLPFIIAGLAYALPASAEHRLRRVHSWATENVVTLTADVEVMLERVLTWRNRLSGVAMLLLGSLIGATALAWPDFWDSAGSQPFSLVIVVLVAMTLALSFQFGQAWLPAGPTRTARPRAVGLADYVPSTLRTIAWISGATCLAAIALMLGTQPTSWILAAQCTPQLSVVAALLFAEWNGRRAAAKPLPARNEIELYAQDALRTGLARAGFQSIALWGGLSLTMLPENLPWPAWLGVAFEFAGGALLLLSIVALLLPYPAINWTRKRLWPRLRPGEYVGLDGLVLA